MKTKGKREGKGGNNREGKGEEKKGRRRGDNPGKVGRRPRRCGTFAWNNGAFPGIRTSYNVSQGATGADDISHS